MSRDNGEEIDVLERRCPRLGGEVRFAYCRSCGKSGISCFKILDCWWERFDVATYMKSRLSQEEYAGLENPKPPSKVGSLIELIQKAQRNTASFEDES